MKRERWEEVDRLYRAALEREPASRASFLDEACAGDDELRSEVASLLASDGQGNFLGTPAVEVAAKGLGVAAASSFIGRRIGHYQVLSLLGAGGMGEVYLARDTRLNRKVAIKFLPALFAEHTSRLRRFEQEARATSALNHPNILTIYDIGADEGLPYIVAELLEGEELRAQLKQGALPVRKALDYAQQVVQGLAAAHEKGIVHRDLKPENLFLTTDGRVKILDFGLAKLKAQAGEPIDSQAATQKRLTDEGTVMGTVGYMAPEQVRGHEADHRADIFAFGVILYEMLSGKRPFKGDSSVEVMNAILKEEPTEFDELGLKIAPGLEKIARRCLEKNPERRFHSAHDLGFALEALATSSALSGTSGGNLATVSGTTVRGGRRERGWMIATIALALFALGLCAIYFNRSSASTSVVRLAFSPPENLIYDNGPFDNVVVSPDGQKLAFSARSVDGKRQIWVRALGAEEAQPLAGTDDPVLPFWSPDSRSLGFGGQGKLKRVDLAGGKPQTLANAIRFYGGSWNREGVIIFVPNESSGVFQIPATGGKPRQLTTPTLPEVRHQSPCFLPDGRHFLYQAGGSTLVGSLDSQEAKQVLADGGPAMYALPGWLLFIRTGALWAQRFDADQLEPKGEAVSLSQSTDVLINRGPPFSVSENGVLIWQGNRLRESEFIWFDREGKQRGAVGAQVKLGAAGTPSLSPDGKRLAISPLSPQVLNQDVWVIDLARDLPTRLTFDPGRDVTPIWSPDGSRVAYFSVQRGGIYQRAANGAGTEELLVELRSVAISDWSPDGRFILYSRLDEQTGRDIGAVSLKERQFYPLLNTEFGEWRAQLSPNGRWLAYVSDESGYHEIYVQPFTADGKLGGAKQRISIDGGSHPRWRRDGRELFYVTADGQMMAVGVQTSGATFEHGTPQALFKTRMMRDTPMGLGSLYDVAADGQRFVVATMVGEASPVSVILNWTADTKLK